MRFTIQVTQTDIESGCPQGTSDCPIALALYRTVGFDPEWEDIDVDPDGLFVMGRRRLRRASGPLPQVARDFIHDFDCERPVSPIDFPLTIWNWCLDLRHRQGAE